MTRKTQKIITFILSLSLSFLSIIVGAMDSENWELSMKMKKGKSPNGINYNKHIPIISYESDLISTQLEFRNINIENGNSTDSIEWELEYKITENLILKHEYLHFTSTDKKNNELTVVYFKKLGSNFSIGYELEIDYFNGHGIDIYGLELEPTIKWQDKIGNFKLYAELEFPTLQLYKKEQNRNKISYEGFEVNLALKTQISKGLNLKFTYRIPYAATKKSYGNEVGIQLSKTF